MNRAALIACTFLLFASAANVAAQRPDGWVEVPFSQTVPNRRSFCTAENGVYDAAKLAELSEKPGCKEALAELKADPEKRTIAFYAVGGDCHMRVRVKVFYVPAEKAYKVIVNKILGGCRAGGWRSGWVDFEKVPAGHSVDVITVSVDHTYRDPEDEFAFPKPPTTKTIDPLRSTTIEFSQCLPLTGQSQWILRGREHIDRAFEGKPNARQCLGQLNDLGFDPEKEMLVGFSFSSGHCERPEVNIDLFYETSSDPRENRVIIRSAFTRPETPCRTWTTHGFWIRAPRIDSTHRFDIKPKAQ